MEFTLFYRGPLKANRGSKDKQDLRRYFHPQLKNLWEQLPLREHKALLNEKPERKIGSNVSLRQNIKGFQFVPLVSERIDLIAELDITLLRPEAPGSIITKAGDIDNRLKTLLDALKMPKEPDAIPNGDGPKEGETPFFCLLEDDNLITKLSVRTDRLLDIKGPHGFRVGQIMDDGPRNIHTKLLDSRFRGNDEFYPLYFTKTLIS